ncbi:MAG: alpha-ketoglutaric semialdehyde dehydrogenase [Gaiellales bacterium]|jgi:aldehyde dehydrogenase (NAD+)|nr:alpha-ketoglutaric semialdehyde dehydrogenase [Gaiellales bacterium]
MSTTAHRPTIISQSPQQPGDVIGTWADVGPDGLDEALRTARKAWHDWRSASAHERSRALVGAAARVDAAANELTSLVVREVGKPIVEATGEVARIADTLRYYAQVALDVDGDMYPASDPASWVFTRRRPRGVAAVITPWNFPLALPMWKIAPALAFGNAVVFKPSRNGLASAMRLVEVLDLGDILQVVCLGSEAEQLLPARDDVDIVSFTGSTEVGRAVVTAAATAGSVFQVEMGGHNAALVLVDADIDQAASSVARAAMAFAGQKCTATKRVIVVGDPSRFEDALVEHVRALALGDPSDTATVIGPVIDERAQRAVLDAAQQGVAEGGRLLTGGRKTEGDGWFAEPAVLAGLPAGATLLRRETFGPICAVVSARDDAEAVEIANETAYGMVAAIYSRDIGRVMSVAPQLDVGILRVNGPTTGIDFNVPFVGHKASGQGLGEQARAARDLFTTSVTYNISPSPVPEAQS